MNKEEIEDRLHYLKVIQSNMSYLQPEVRDAINYAVKIMEDKKKEEETETQYQGFSKESIVDSWKTDRDHTVFVIEGQGLSVVPESKIKKAIEHFESEWKRTGFPYGKMAYGEVIGYMKKLFNSDE